MMLPEIATIRAQAESLDFVACGVASLEPSTRPDQLDSWLAAGYAGSMGYMPRQAAKRKVPANIVPGANSAVVVLDNYAAPDSEAGRTEDQYLIARYARGTDYHLITTARLQRLADWLLTQGASIARVYVDAGPVPERELAERAGLGWIGKNTMLINPQIGSWTFIGAIFTDLTMPPVTIDRVTMDRCGTCTRCIDACPTGAIVAERVVDARRCISYLTIESKAEPPAELAGQLAGWAFGCDICNEVCPWNLKFAAPTTVADFTRRDQPDRTDLGLFDRMTELEFEQQFSDTPLARPGLTRMRRNIRLARTSSEMK
jgi:epoxyqueuosine reductase